MTRTRVRRLAEARVQTVTEDRGGRNGRPPSADRKAANSGMPPPLLSRSGHKFGRYTGIKTGESAPQGKEQLRPGCVSQPQQFQAFSLSGQHGCSPLVSCADEALVVSMAVPALIAPSIAAAVCGCKPSIASATTKRIVARYRTMATFLHPISDFVISRGVRPSLITAVLKEMGYQS